MMQNQIIGEMSCKSWAGKWYKKYASRVDACKKKNNNNKNANLLKCYQCVTKLINHSKGDVNCSVY